MATMMQELGKNLNQAWSSVTEGWRELLNRSSSALTRFIPRKSAPTAQPAVGSSFPRWSLLAGEVIDTGNSIVVQVELPGIEREDCDITIDERSLRIRGERRTERDRIGDNYYVMERAYGTFERVIPLPFDIDRDSAQATLRNGVLRVELEKRPSATRRVIEVR